MSKKHVLYSIITLFSLYIVFILLTKEAKVAYSIAQKKYQNTQQYVYATNCSDKEKKVKEILDKYKALPENKDIVSELETVLNE